MQSSRKHELRSSSSRETVWQFFSLWRSAMVYLGGNQITSSQNDKNYELGFLGDSSFVFREMERNWHIHTANKGRWKHVWSMLLCGRGTWTISKIMEKTESRRDAALKKSSENVVDGKSYKWMNIWGNGDKWGVSESYQEKTASVPATCVEVKEDGDLCLTPRIEERGRRPTEQNMNGTERVTGGGWKVRELLQMSREKEDCMLIIAIVLC